MKSCARLMGGPARARGAVHTTALLAGAALLALLAGCSGPKTGPSLPEGATAKQVGPLTVAVANRPDPARLGTNTMLITLRDSSGRPVSGAEIEPTVVMQAMGAMPRMESRGKVKETGPGQYEAAYELGMTGEWDVSVSIRAAGLPEVQASYRLSTSTKGMDFVSGTPSPGAGGATPDAGGPAQADTQGASVVVDVALRQTLGLTTEPVRRRDLTSTVRTAGRVVYDETRTTDVTLKYSGYVREVRADFTGGEVKKGEVLFTAYSPELLAAQQEYLEALAMARADSARSTTSELVSAARRKLSLWDLGTGEIERLERSGKPSEAVPVVSSAAGVVTEKAVVRGSAFNAGQMLYRIAPKDPVWVLATLYQYDLPRVRAGMQARVLNPYLGERGRAGRVVYVYPSLSGDTRTGEARVEVSNSSGELKPGMFVDVELMAPLAGRLAVPVSAVIYTGERRVVFVDMGDGRLAPRDVRLGQRSGDYFEVLDGLKEGQRVVTSGNFLVAAESRLKSALQKWEGR